MDEHLLKHIRNEYAVRSDWLAQAKRFRENAELFGKLDPTLGTLCKRMALAIEQYYDRVTAHLQVMTYDRIDARAKELEDSQREVDELLARVLAPKQQP